MSRAGKFSVLFMGTALASPLAWADVAIGETSRQPVNLHAIALFFCFVLFTLGITVWAAKRSRSASDFYSAGGGISSMQNGLALAGDYMSASTLLGITAIIYTDGIDGYIYLIAFFTGWPVLLLLMTDRLRNLYSPSRMSRRTAWRSVRSAPCRRWAPGRGLLLPDRPDGWRVS